MSIGGIASRAADAAKAAAKAAAEAARKAAEEAARKAAEAAKAAAEAAQKASEGAQKATEDVKAAGEKVSSVAADRARDAFEDSKDAVSGAADKAKEAVGGAVDKAKEAASGAVNKAKETASGAVDKAKETASGAVDKAKETASGAVNKAKEVAGGAVDKAKEVAGGAVDKAKEVAGGAVDKAKEAASGAVNKAQEVAGAASDKVKSAAGRAKDTYQDARGAAGEQVKRAAEGIKDTAQEAYGEAISRGIDALNGAHEAGKQVQENGPEAAAQSFDETVQKLGKGDQVSVSLDQLEGDLAGVQVEGSGNVSLSRDDAGKLVARAEGELGAGLIAAAGGQATGAGGAEAKAGATLNGGAAVEFKFDNEQELREGLKTMGKSAAVAGAAAAGTPVAGVAAQQLIGPSKEELSALGKNLSAVEVSAGVTGDGSAALGALGFKAGTQGELGADAALRMNFDEGQLKDITARAQLHLNNTTEAAAGGELKVSGALEQKYEVPKDLKAADILKNPSAVTKQLNELRTADEASLKVKVEGQGFARYAGVKGAAGGELEVEVKGDLKKLQESSSLQNLARGDVPGAIDQAQEDYDVQAMLKTYTSAEAEFNLSGHLGVAGGGVKATAAYKDQHGPGTTLVGEEAENVLQQEFQRNQSRPIRG